jgi:hypothetical protein
VNLCGDPVAYAAALAELEGLRASSGELALAASGGSLLQRIKRVLGAPTHAGRAPGWLAAGMALVLVAACRSAPRGPMRAGAQVEISAVEPDQVHASTPAPPSAPAPPAAAATPAAPDAPTPGAPRAHRRCPRTSAAAALAVAVTACASNRCSSSGLVSGRAGCGKHPAQSIRP